VKLVLASQGFTTLKIAQATEQLLGKPLAKANLAIINEAYTASAPGHDKKWLINELALISKYIGGTIDFVNLRAYGLDEVKQRLDFADIVYIVGGKQIVLSRLFRETGFDKLLRQIANSKVVFGTSAGAMLLGADLPIGHLEARYGSAQEFVENPYLHLVNFNIMPHFGRADHAELTAERLGELLKGGPKVYAINDEQAVLFSKGQLTFAGGQPLEFGG
jgi:peptidase E